MTPQEALAQAMLDVMYDRYVGDDGRGVRHLHENIDRDAAAILDALPEGWEVRTSSHSITEREAAWMRAGAQQERERLRERYRYVRSRDAGPYVYEPTDLVTVALMDTVVDALLACPAGTALARFDAEYEEALRHECAACGHPPHTDLCTWDVMYEGEGIPPYHLSCACDGMSGPRVLGGPTP